MLAYPLASKPCSEATSAIISGLGFLTLAERRELLQRFYRDSRGFLPALELDWGGRGRKVSASSEVVCEIINGLVFLTFAGCRITITFV